MNIPWDHLWRTVAPHDEALERALRLLLRCKGWTPETLAERSGVDRLLVNLAVEGYAPPFAILRRLCKALGVGLAMLLLVGDWLVSTL